MSSQSAKQLPRNQRYFATYVIATLVAVVLLLSFSEADRRGLVFTDIPESFAADEIVQQRQAFAIAIGRQPGTTAVGDRPSRTIRRLLPAFAAPPSRRARQTETTGTPGGATPTGGEALPIAAGQAGAGAGPQQLSLADVSPPGFGTGPVGVLPINDPGSPGTPGTEIPTDPPVPTVPEPASWLLMIVGVAILGKILRHRAVSGEVALA